jgi:hypothetical protein
MGNIAAPPLRSGLSGCLQRATGLNGLLSGVPLDHCGILLNVAGLFPTLPAILSISGRIKVALQPAGRRVCGLVLNCNQFGGANSGHRKLAIVDHYCDLVAGAFQGVASHRQQFDELFVGVRDFVFHLILPDSGVSWLRINIMQPSCQYIIRLCTTKNAIF